MDTPAEPPAPAGAAVPRAHDELAAWAASLALDPEALDEIVHEAFSSQAASVNNDGLDSQVRFLAAACGADQARALIGGCRRPARPADA